MVTAFLRQENLEQFRLRLEKAAGPDTAFRPDAWSPYTLKSHCGPVSYTVQQEFGGDVLSGTVNGERHLWNRLPDYSEVDFCSEQYGGDGITPVAAKGRVFRPRKGYNKRFERFYHRFKEAQ